MHHGLKLVIITTGTEYKGLRNLLGHYGVVEAGWIQVAHCSHRRMAWWDCGSGLDMQLYMYNVVMSKIMKVCQK